jgi:hypothetical protein
MGLAKHCPSAQQGGGDGLSINGGAAIELWHSQPKNTPVAIFCVAFTDTPLL